MTIVGIMGLGTVGGTLADAFDAAQVSTRGFDPYLGTGSLQDLAECQVVFVCVPTPGDQVDGFDLRSVRAAVLDVSAVLGPGSIVAVKSTVPPGTCDALASTYPDLLICSVPEFLVAAQPQESLARPDRVVIGAPTEDAGAVLADLMSRISPAAPIIRMRPIEAELVKLCSNVMLASKVALANELALICGRFGVQWGSVQSAVGLDRRIGPDHLSVTSRRGFGGGCFPKDLDGLIAASRETGHVPTVLVEIAAFNRRLRGEGEAKQIAFEAGAEEIVSRIGVDS